MRLIPVTAEDLTQLSSYLDDRSLVSVFELCLSSRPASEAGPSLYLSKLHSKMLGTCLMQSVRSESPGELHSTSEWYHYASDKIAAAMDDLSAVHVQPWCAE